MALIAILGTACGPGDEGPSDAVLDDDGTDATDCRLGHSGLAQPGCWRRRQRHRGRGRCRSSCNGRRQCYWLGLGYWFECRHRVECRHRLKRGHRVERGVTLIGDGDAVYQSVATVANGSAQGTYSVRIADYDGPTGTFRAQLSFLPTGASLTDRHYAPDSLMTVRIYDSSLVESDAGPGADAGSNLDAGG